jgi:hypothetical protein
VITTAALSIAAAGYVGWLLLERGKVLALSAGLISIASACICFVHGLEWRHRVERLRANDEQFRPPVPRAAQAPQGGFADNVDKLFNHYFATYVPRGTDRVSGWRLRLGFASLCETRSSRSTGNRESRPNGSPG